MEYRYLYVSLIVIIVVFGILAFIIEIPSYVSVSLFIPSILLIVFFRNPNVITSSLILTIPLLIGYSDAMSILSNSPYSVSLLGMLNIALPFLIIAYLIVNKIKIRSCSLHVPITIFLTVLGISVFYADSPIRGLREWFRIGMPIMFYYIGLTCIDITGEVEKTVFKKLNLILISSFVPLVIGFWQLIKGDYSDVPVALHNRIYGTFGHPNRFAIFLVISALVTIFLFLNHKSFLRRTMYFIYLCAIVISLFFTFTRIGWLAFFFSISIFGFLRYRKFYILFLTLLISVFLFVPGATKSFTKRAKADDSFYGRFDLNELSIRLYKQKPFLGHGLSSYVFLSGNVSSIVKIQYGETVGIGQHNDYLKFLTECGIFGLISYLFLIYSSLKLSKRLYSTHDSSMKAYGTLAISIIFVVTIVGLSDIGLQLTGIYPWLLLGMGELQLSKLEKQNRMDLPSANIDI